MYFSSGSLGCLAFIIITIISLYLLKELWWLIVGIALILIVFYWGKQIYLLIKTAKDNQKSNYNPQMGEVFKICPYCNSKVKVTEVCCPNCKHALN